MSEESASPFFPELEANFTPTPNWWYDELLPQLTSVNEIKVTEILIRQTYGWQRRRAQISLSCSQIAQLTRLSKSNAFDGLKLALARGYVYRIQTGAQRYAYGIRVGEGEPTISIQTIKTVPQSRTVVKSKTVPQSRTVPYPNPARLADESLYAERKENKREQMSASDAQPSNHRRPLKGRGFPTCETQTMMRLPADFSVTAEMRSWAEKNLPPATLARLDNELLVSFVRKWREEHPHEMRAGLAAWVAKWKNAMTIAAGFDRKSERGGNGRAMVALDDGPSYDDLVAAGTMPAIM